MPRVSVFMPVHNGEPFVGPAIDSVLGQTLSDLELVIVENGSSDGSRETVRAAAARDSRVRLLEHQGALGVVAAGNAGVRASRAMLVARHDQDDLSDPRRLERQVEALARAPEAVAIGTLAVGVGADGRRLRPRDRWPLVGRSALPPFPHGSVCFRRDVFERVGGYREGTYGWEDVDLFLRLEREGPVLVLPEALYRYRYHAASYTASSAGRDDGAPLMWRCVAAHRRGDDWTTLLGAASEPKPPAPPATAWAMRHGDGVRLWSGIALGVDPEAPATAVTRARRAWQRVSPGSLRSAKRAAITLRDLAAVPLVPRRVPVRWRPR